MIAPLASFADQVTTVAREVGVEGKLGGQAKVPGAAGTWKALTENVNQLAANLTTQVRAIAEVDRKSTRLNSSHGYISYAVFCLKKKKKNTKEQKKEHRQTINK